MNNSEVILQITGAIDTEFIPHITYWHNVLPKLA